MNEDQPEIFPFPFCEDPMHPSLATLEAMGDFTGFAFQIFLSVETPQDDTQGE